MKKLILLVVITFQLGSIGYCIGIGSLASRNMTRLERNSAHWSIALRKAFYKRTGIHTKSCMICEWTKVRRGQVLRFKIYLEKGRRYHFFSYTRGPVKIWMEWPNGSLACSKSPFSRRLEYIFTPDKDGAYWIRLTTSSRRLIWADIDCTYEYTDVYNLQQRQGMYENPDTPGGNRFVMPLGYSMDVL